MRKNILIIGVIVIVVCVLLIGILNAGLFIGGFSVFPFNYESAEEEFEKNKELMYSISNYFEGTEYDNTS